MKVVNKEIEMIAHFSKEGIPVPIKFKFDEKVIKVDKTFETWQEKKAGIKTISYKCQTYHEERQQIIPYEIRFDTVSLKWFLYKI